MTWRSIISKMKESARYSHLQEKNLAAEMVAMLPKNEKGMKINRTFKIIFALLLIVPAVYGQIAGRDSVQTVLSSAVSERIRLGIEFTINNQFDKALSIFNQLVREKANRPAGYFYKGATLQARMQDEENFSQLEIFYGLMDSTIIAAGELNNQSGENAWNYFFEGSAFLYRSMLKSKFGNWLAAYRDAIRGSGNLEKALELDSTMYDAYLGIGSFKYWKSAKSGFLSWLPFVSDEREEGIRMVRLAIKKGMLSRWVGSDQLAWILLNEKKCPEALKITRANHQAFPDSRFFMWTLVEATQRCGEAGMSYPYYEELLAEIRQLKQNNHYNEIECLLRLAQMDFSSSRWYLAFRRTDKILRFHLQPEVRKRSRHKLKQALKIKKEAEEKLKKLSLLPVGAE